MAGTGYQMLEVLAFCNLERAQPPSTTITVLTLLVKKVQWRIQGCLSFDNTRKNFKSNLVLVGVLVLEPKGLYFLSGEAATRNEPRGKIPQFDLLPIFTRLRRQKLQHAPANPVSYAGYQKPNFPNEDECKTFPVTMSFLGKKINTKLFSYQRLTPLGRFQKEAIANSLPVRGFSWYDNMAAVSLFWNTNNGRGEVMWKRSIPCIPCNRIFSYSCKQRYTMELSLQASASFLCACLPTMGWFPL